MKKFFLVVLFLSAFVNAGYNNVKAMAYALKYAKNPNPSYRFYENGDCTNFVSQAIKAGGIKYDYNGNKEYKKWYKYSESWQWASTFRLRAYYGGFGAKKISRNQLKVGDLVIFDLRETGSNQKHRFNHVTIVTRVDSDQYGEYPKVSYHTRNKRNVDLDWIMNYTDRVEYYRPR